MLLEIALATLEDAQTAHRAGADRIELNDALHLDGLTPSLQTLIAIKQSIPLPIIAMLRPRAGNFCYSDADYLTMQKDADLLLHHGATGLAFGLLTPDLAIDKKRTATLLKQIKPNPSVFHRAFDVVKNPFEALEQLIDLGFTRILTSGQQPTAPQGATLIRQLVEKSAGRIEILPGAGITPHNARALIQETGATQLHGSFSIEEADGRRRTSAELIRATRAVLGA